ncbi:MAG: inosine-uridine nucleoside N-ribohydrolase, partial [Alphaproteobacteria bacterium]
MLAHYHQTNKLNLIAATSSKSGVLSADVLAWLLAYYKLDIPVGYCIDGALQPKQKYLELLPTLKEAFSSVSATSTKPATEILEQALLANKKITVVMIGNSSNIAQILNSPSLNKLFHEKVEKIIWMAGEFDRAYAENNIRVDYQNSHVIFDKWQGKLELLPSNVGKKVIFPGHHLIDRQEPVAQMYNDYMKRGWGRECWDPLTILYASGTAPELFKLSKLGKVTLDSNEITEFHEQDNGNHLL